MGDAAPMVLVASTPIPAHTLNATAFVRGVIAAGGRVVWSAHPRFADHVASCGATFAPLPGPLAPPAWAARNAWHGLAAVRALYRDAVAGPAQAQARGLAELARRWGAGVILSDTLMAAASPAAELGGIPWATFGDGPLLHWDPDTPPFGTGLPPMPGPFGRDRNRRVQQVADALLFSPAVRSLNHTRAALGLPPVSDIRAATLSPTLHLQGSAPSFEYPRRDRPASVVFVGALGPGPGLGEPLPPALRRRPGRRPLALVTQGTMRPDPTELIVPACRALAAEGFEVVVAGASRKELAGLVGAATVLPLLDYADAMPHLDLFVTNGGWTGVTLALAAGVGVVQCGATEEKPDIGARLVWSGAGASIRLTRPGTTLVRAAVRRVARSPRRRLASARLAAEFAGLDAAAIGGGLLLELATGQRP